MTNEIIKTLDTRIDKLTHGLGFYEVDRKGEFYVPWTACYAVFDKTRKERVTGVWFPPCWAKIKYNTDMDGRVFWARHAVTDDDSPWKHIVDVLREDYLKGCENADEEAAIIAKYGLYFTSNAMNKLGRVDIGCFAVFNRVPYEYEGVRHSLRNFLTHPDTKDFPKRWNVFAAHHIRGYAQGHSKGLGLLDFVYSNGHNCFDWRIYPHTALAYVTAEPRELKTPPHWDVSFMNGNSDLYFLKNFKRNPIENFEFKGVDYDMNIIQLNVELYNRLVKPYV